MLNFELYNPTKIIFGKNQLQNIAKELPKGVKILLLYGGGSIFKNGVYEAVTSNLSGFDIVEFGGVEANPTFETLCKAVEVVRREHIGFVLAVGGGSVIDGAKFVITASVYQGHPLDIFYRKHRPTEALPFGVVLTLPATGSEMNSGAVITRTETNEKLSFGSGVTFPKFSFCDPTVIVSLPKRQLQNGVIDAFTHVLEQYVTYSHGAILQDKIAESVLQTLVEIGAKVTENPADYHLASNFMWSCTMALNGLLSKGVPTDWATHFIGHELTALYGIDHARTLAIIAPNLYRVLFDTKKEKLAQLGRNVFKLSGEDTQVAAEAIEKLEEFFHSVGMKTKISENTTENIENTATIIVKRFEERGFSPIGERQNITLEKIHEIVLRSY
ncbi:MAG: iron-containing alcohol dehydrogenase [Capnocytophaga sp.]|nr:iron-containing alcohol dehydrogenase [Capnocytophaga sp.]